MADPAERMETDDVDADIRAAMSEVANDTPPAKEVVVAPEAVVQPEPEAPKPETETAEQVRARDEAGRFAKAEKAAQNASAIPPAATEPQAEAIRPPVSWSATAKALFDKLDPAIQQEVLKRERDMETGVAQWASKGERLNKFDAIIAPHRDRLQLAQQDEFRYIQALVTADEMLRNNPQQAIQQIAAMYGINLNGQTALPQPMAQPHAQVMTPQAIQQQATEAAQAAFRQWQDEQLHASALSEWESFRISKDHPYAENVKGHMAALLREGHADDLSSAYEQACWANPEVRTLLLAEKQKPPQPMASQPAGLSVTGARGNGQIQVRPGSPTASIEDDIRAAIMEVQGRA